MPKGFTIDVQIGRQENKDDIRLLQVIFIVKNDEFDEPLIDPVDAQGKSDEETAKMAYKKMQASGLAKQVYLTTIYNNRRE